MAEKFTHPSAERDNAGANPALDFSETLLCVECVLCDRMSYNTTDALTEAHVENFISDAMSEEGIEPYNIAVRSWTDDAFGEMQTMGIEAMKYINGVGEKVRVSISLPPEDMKDADKFQKELSVAAKDLVSHFESMMVDEVEISGTRLKFCSADGGWAECLRCGERVKLDNVARNGFVMGTEAELSHPSPTPYDTRKFLKRLDEGETEMLKLYLFGALRNRCHCDYGKQSDYVH